jgi:L-lactate dehydrogenase complex protein LldG
MVGEAGAGTQQVSETKDEVLQRVRAALRDVQGTREAEYRLITRDYLQTSGMTTEQRLALFMDRLHDYDAVVYPCRESHIAETIARALAARGKSRMVLPSGVPESWLPQNIEWLRGSDLSFDFLDKSDGVITGCAVAIAFTGTIVLEHSAENGRRAPTLIPDYHLCVVRAEQVVSSVPEAMGRMGAFTTAPITTISGPSATADIEMTRIKGVHGPRFLDVVLVSE